MISALSMPQALRDRIAEEALKAYPGECCGLIEGTRDGNTAAAAAIHSTRNVAKTPDRFEIDPAEHIRLLRAAREKEHTIIGCYHSHPNGVSEPSAADRAGAGEEDFVWLIAAVGKDKKAKIAAFVYGARAFAPIRLARAKGAKV